MSEVRLIDANALMERLERKKCEPAKVRYTEGYNDALMRFRSMVHGAPTVEAVPKSELFELFDRITTAWNGKQRFFRQDDGTIYDRNKCDYVKSLDDAVNRFCIELA